MIDPSSSEEESDDGHGKKGSHSSHGTHHSLPSKHHQSNHHIGNTGGVPLNDTHSNAPTTQQGFTETNAIQQKQNTLSSSAKAGKTTGNNEQHGKTNIDSKVPAISGNVSESVKHIKGHSNKESLKENNYVCRATSDNGSMDSAPNKMARLVDF